MSQKSNKVRPDGRIAVQVFIGTVDGKRKYKTVYGKTQKEAEAAAKKIRDQIDHGIDISANTTFKSCAESWLKTKKSSTTGSWYSVLEARADFWVDLFSENKIEKINISNINDGIEDLSCINPYTNKPSSKKTLKEYVNVLKAIFNYAVQNRIINFNPAEFVKIPKNASKLKRRSLTNSEIDMIINTPHQMQTAAMIMLFAGLRRGEVGALTWRDIDLERRTITVNKSTDLKNKDGNVIKTPKTDAGNRIVPIFDPLYDYLIKVPKESIMIYTRSNGRPYTENSWKDGWANYLSKLNQKYGDFSNIYVQKGSNLPMVINTFSPHYLRHTFCTLLIESGVALPKVQEFMGHNDIQTTLAIYTHLRKENSNDSSIKKANAYFKQIESASQNASQNSQ